MGKFIRIKYEDMGEMQKFINVKYGNCVKCGKYCRYDLHHTITQSRGGTKTVQLCRECHNWVGVNIERAKQLNLYIEGYEKGTTKPNTK
jgi:hypothetical protein